MKIRATVVAIEDGLRAVGTRERAEGEKRYLKSDLEFLGATVPQVRKNARAWLSQHGDLDQSELLRLVAALWRRPIHESRSFGVELLTARVDQLTAPDLALVEWILRRANSWAHVDPVAIQVAGPLVEANPALEADLDRWALDEELWLRRSVLLAHLVPLRQGAGKWRRFVRYADQMLEEREFFIRKAIGWVLRETAKQHPDRVIGYLETRLDRISGLSLREAIRPLSSAEQERLRDGYRRR